MSNKHEYAGQPYHPSNGSEGDWFCDKHCWKCIHCDPDPNGKKQCDILCATFWFSPKDPEYPKEWIYDDNGKPTCTSWVKWDWNNDGDPDDPDNPNAPPQPIPYNPNQLLLPFEINEIALTPQPTEQLEA